MPKYFNFSRKFRLKQYQQIQKLFKNGKRITFYPFVFCYLERKDTKVLIKVSKKFGNAVRRNRFKRQVREVIRNSTVLKFKIHCTIRPIINKNTVQNKQAISFDTIQNAIRQFIIFQKQTH